MYSLKEIFTQAQDLDVLQESASQVLERLTNPVALAEFVDLCETKELQQKAIIKLALALTIPK